MHKRLQLITLRARSNEGGVPEAGDDFSLLNVCYGHDSFRRKLAPLLELLALFPGVHLQGVHFHTCTLLDTALGRVAARYTPLSRPLAPRVALSMLQLFWMFFFPAAHLFPAIVRLSAHTPDTV